MSGADAQEIVTESIRSAASESFLPEAFGIKLYKFGTLVQ
jgi:hypothetical protein